MSGKMATMQNSRETFKFPVCNYKLTNSCFIQWPWTFGEHWKRKKLQGSPQRYTINDGAMIPTLPESLPGIKSMLFFCNKPQCSCYSPSKISWSDIEQRMKDHFHPSQCLSVAAHRSKRRPEFFPNYFKPLFEGWRRRGIEVSLCQNLALLNAF